MAANWSQNGQTYTQSNSGQTLTYGQGAEMAITALGNINKTPGLGLTDNLTDYDSKYATYLKIFSGEMIKAYESTCIAKGNSTKPYSDRNGRSLCNSSIQVA